MPFLGVSKSLFADCARAMQATDEETCLSCGPVTAEIGN